MGILSFCSAPFCAIYVPCLFLSPQFINLNLTVTTDQKQTLFRCKHYSSQSAIPGLSGIAFDLHNETSSRDSFCVWGGSECRFNRLVDFIALRAPDKYRFAVTGLLLETPGRQIRHDASAALLDNSMIIIGRRSETTSKLLYPLEQLRRPFRLSTWGVFLGMVGIFATLALIIAIRFDPKGGRMRTLFFIFAGERGEDRIQDKQDENIQSPLVESVAPPEAIVADHSDHENRSPAANGEISVDMKIEIEETTPQIEIAQSQELEALEREVPSISTRYWAVINFFRLSFGAFVLIFVLFYEVAVVNFLFQQSQVTINQPVKSLSREELEKYSVLKASALEDVWHQTGT